MSPTIAAQFAGPWPDGIALTRTEVSSYIEDVADGSLDPLATRCEPWSVRDVTIHLAETFRRFQLMQEQGRRGDFTAPFTPGELDAENLRAVEAFTGDPVEALDAAANGFLDALARGDEPIPHQLDTLPSELVVLFGLMDVSIHHDDVLSAAGRSYRPAPGTIDAIVPVAERLFGMPPDQADPWATMLAGSGRVSQ